MGREQYANAAATTLNGGINNSTTTVVVTDGSTFPSALFRVKIDSEIMIVTSRSTNTLTVVRAQEGTSAASHADLAAVNAPITKGTLDQYRLDLLQDIGLVPKDTSLSADDDEFDDESFSSWTSVATTPALTTLELSHRVHFTIPTGSASAQLYGFMKAKTPSSGQYVQAGFRMFTYGGQFPQICLIMADGATYGAGKQAVWRYSPHENQFFLSPFTNYNTHGGNSLTLGSTTGNYANPAIHLRLTWKGSNQFDTSVSLDGLSWLAGGTNTTCNSIGTVTHMGFGISSWGSLNNLGIAAHYCRFNF